MSKFSEKLKAVAGKLFINGEYVESRGGKKFDVINPATEEVFAQAVAGTQEDVDLAVSAARKAFEGGWGKMDAN